MSLITCDNFMDSENTIGYSLQDICTLLKIQFQTFCRIIFIMENSGSLMYELKDIRTHTNISSGKMEQLTEQDLPFIYFHADVLCNNNELKSEVCLAFPFPLKLDNTDTMLTVKPSIYTDDSMLPGVISKSNIISECILNRHRLVMIYQARGSIQTQSKIEVCPLKIVFDYSNGHAYMLTLQVDRTQYTQFNSNANDLKSPIVPWRIDRIVHCDPTDRTFLIPSGEYFSLHFLNSLWGMDFDLSRGPVHVRVYFQHFGNIWSRVRKDVASHSDENEKDKLTIYHNMLCYEDDIYGYNSFMLYIMSYGKSAYVAYAQSGDRDMRTDLLKAANERYKYHTDLQGE